ncbi:hypothetical protein AMECASPLE_039748 [Ameca splendens]|uniref:Uncharacterized protein n=1 Tax=Ameca splendens TaxID=208324 RepID=A0ABV0YJX1_9TELE
MAKIKLPEMQSGSTDKLHPSLSSPSLNANEWCKVWCVLWLDKSCLSVWLSNGVWVWQLPGEHTCMAVLSSIKFGARRVMVGVCFSGVRFGTICLFSSTTQLHSTRPHSTPHGSCCISIDSLMAGVMAISPTSNLDGVWFAALNVTVSSGWVPFKRRVKRLG